jgi:hypothetical protein
MVTSPMGLRPKKDYAGECQQHIQKSDTSSRQRGRPQNRAVIVKDKLISGRRPQMGALFQDKLAD